MSKRLLGALAVSATVAFANAAAADPDDNFGGNSDTWFNDFDDHFVNTNNPDLRQDWATGRRAIPGGAAQSQADNPTTNDSDNNVISRPESTLVDPHHTLP